MDCVFHFMDCDPLLSISYFMTSIRTEPFEVRIILLHLIDGKMETERSALFLPSHLARMR
jgi:hypothetical protein